MRFERRWHKFRTARVGTYISSMRHSSKLQYWRSRVGKPETIEVIRWRWGVAMVESVKPWQFDTIPLITIQLDMEPDWTRDDAVRYLRGHYPDFMPTDNVTFIWLKVIELERPKGGIRREDVLRQEHIV